MSIAIPNKEGAECDHHRTFITISHVTKVLLRIIMQKVRKNIIRKRGRTVDLLKARVQQMLYFCKNSN